MAEQAVHEKHPHLHGPNCGHMAIRHRGHVDYLHDGHLHEMQGSQVVECTVAVDGANPNQCTPQHVCASHDVNHRHGPGCGHEAVPHSDHVDYFVGGHLHHPHDGHCDDHGKLTRA